MPVITGHDPGANNEAFVIPRGVYKTIITDIEEKTSHAGNLGLVVEFQIVEGQYKDRVSSTWLNTGHPKEDVKRIAMGQFNSFFDSLGIERSGNTDEILNRPMNISWNGKLDEGGYASYSFYPTDKEPTIDTSQNRQGVQEDIHDPDGVPF